MQHSFRPLLVFCLFSGLVAGAAPLASAQEAPASAPRRAMTAVRLAPEERITLDGRFDEAVWSRARPATDFVQQDPVNGAPPTERTEVRIAFSSEALYMAVTCFDSEPDRLYGNTMKRDEFLRADDRFMWVFDPFLNGQGGYFFEMNPSGLMADSLMSATGPVSREWDGIWNARTLRSEIGWTIEIEIPFRTLNFDPAGGAWGVNFQRTVRRKNEESLWSGWGYNQGLFRIQNSGLLLGISEVVQGRGLDLRPYGVATAASSPGRGQAARSDADAGLDVYYSLTPAVRTNLTINTDFAQTEVDQRQVNLTRFSLFFPEKRGFFLEGASFFDFISSTGGRPGSRGRSDTAVVPFFTRRIGLDENGQPQRIDVGGKITGQVGQQDIGLLQLRTGENDGAPGEDFTILRMRRRMLRQSYVGLLYTRRDARGAGPGPASTLGFDYRFGTATFLGNQNLEATGYFLHTTGSEESGRSSAYGLTLDYPNDRYAAGLAFREVQDNYDPAVGFTLRNGYRRYSPYFRFQPRPAGSRLVRQYTFGVDSEFQFDTRQNDPLLREVDVTAFRAQFQSQDSIEAHLISTYERLDYDFPISAAIRLPRGAEHTFTRGRLQASSANSRVLAAAVAVEAGEFYSGHRRGVTLGLGIRPRPGVAIYLDLERNRIELAEGEFATRLYRAVADTQFSPWIALTNNLQYDSVSRVLGWQSRFRWIITPGSDIYLVYNHNWLDDPALRRFGTLDRGLATKLLYTIGL